jgi:hypothetical protein
VYRNPLRPQRVFLSTLLPRVDARRSGGSGPGVDDDIPTDGSNARPQAREDDRRISRPRPAPNKAGNSQVESASREGIFRGFHDQEKPLTAQALEVYKAHESANPVNASIRPPLRLLVISPGYFRTMRIPLIAGRTLGVDDTLRAPKVAIISRRLARALYSDESPLGRQFRIGRAGALVTIVGVTDDIRDPGTATLGQGNLGVPAVHLSEGQALGRPVTHLVRVPQADGRVIAELAGEIRRAVPGLNSFVIRQMPEPEGVLVVRHVAATVVGLGIVAILMAMLGIYAVASYSVVQRTRWIVIQLALGATPRRIYAEILGRGFRLIGYGVVVGLLLGIGIEVLMNPAFWGVSPFSLRLYGGVAALFTLVGSGVPRAWAARRVG